MLCWRCLSMALLQPTSEIRNPSSEVRRLIVDDSTRGCYSHEWTPGLEILCRIKDELRDARLPHALGAVVEAMRAYSNYHMGTLYNISQICRLARMNATVAAHFVVRMARVCSDTYGVA